MGVAQRIVGSSSTAVQEFVEGTMVTAERAEKALSNVNRIDGVDGLDEMVHFLKHNANNANGIDGAVFEGTIARRILDGEVPGSGTLQRVSADGLENADKINTLSSSWAIQIKHKTAPGNYGIADLEGGGDAARQYLDELAAQAASLDPLRTPAFATNRPITDGLMQLLNERGILWRQVDDGL